MDKDQRFLCVLDVSGWQVVDVHSNCKVVAKGQWQPMLAEAKKRNNEWLLSEIKSVANQ